MCLCVFASVIESLGHSGLQNYRSTFVLFLIYYPGQKNRYSRDIHEIDLQCDHVISCDIYFDPATRARDAQCRGSRRCRTEPQYHTIALLINLMNISAVTIFLAGVVGPFFCMCVTADPPGRRPNGVERRVAEDRRRGN